MLLNPARETFLNFPSALLPDKTITVFLPEPAVPLHRQYPVVYILGAIPKDAPAAQSVLEKAQKKAILVGINTEDIDLTDTAKLVSFVSREWVPYIQANYPVIDHPSSRVLVVQNPSGLRAAAALLAQKELFARAVLFRPGEQPISLAGSDEHLRVLIAGRRSEILPLQETLLDKGLAYGDGFVTEIKEESAVWDSINLDYLFAEDDTLQVQKIEGTIAPQSISLPLRQSATLAWKILLKNQMQFDYIAPSLRLSPPYLQWNPQTGEVNILSGAVPGTVKISLFVDKQRWRGKIKLKK